MASLILAALFLSSTISTTHADDGTSFAQQQLRVQADKKARSETKTPAHKQHRDLNAGCMTSRGDDCSFSRCCSNGSSCVHSGIHGSDRYYCVSNVVVMDGGYLTPPTTWKSDGFLTPPPTWKGDAFSTPPTPPPTWKDDGHPTPKTVWLDDGHQCELTPTDIEVLGEQLDMGIKETNEAEVSLKMILNKTMTVEQDLAKIMAECEDQEVLIKSSEDEIDDADAIDKLMRIAKLELALEDTKIKTTEISAGQDQLYARLEGMTDEIVGAQAHLSEMIADAEEIKYFLERVKEGPSEEPSSQPSSLPSSQPSSKPSGSPSSQPSSIPSESPSSQPSSIPSETPSSQPSSESSECPVQARFFTSHNRGRNLGEIDVNTGSGANIGSFGTTETYAIAIHPDEHTVYTLIDALSGNAKLAIVDLLSGAATIVGAGVGVGTSMIALAINSAGQIYGVSRSGYLYLIDATTGTANVIGSGTGINDCKDLSFHSSGALYGMDRNSGLYLIEKDTGAATRLGVIQGMGGRILGMAFDASDTLYGTIWSENSSVYSIDINTLQATLVGATELSWPSGGDLIECS